MTFATAKSPILLADDDEDDYFLVRKAFRDARVVNELTWVRDGEELIHHLSGGGASVAGGSLSPTLVLLDLNMPRMDGREALKRIKSNPKLRQLPVIVLTTSSERADAVISYHYGAKALVHKPLDFPRLVEVIRAVGRHWFEIISTRTARQPSELVNLLLVREITPEVDRGPVWTEDCPLNGLQDVEPDYQTDGQSIVLLDVDPSVSDVREIVRKIRPRARKRSFVFALIDSMEEGMIYRALNIEVDGFLRKPVNLVELMQEIRSNTPFSVALHART